MLWNKQIHVQTWIHSTEKVNKHSNVSHCVHNAWIKCLGALVVVVILLIRFNTFFETKPADPMFIYQIEGSLHSVAFVWNDAKPIYSINCLALYMDGKRKETNRVYFRWGKINTESFTRIAFISEFAHNHDFGK